MKILVVDDDVNICELLRLYLVKEGWDVQVAYNGVKAMELFKSDAQRPCDGVEYQRDPDSEAGRSVFFKAAGRDPGSAGCRRAGRRRGTGHRPEQ